MVLHIIIIYMCKLMVWKFKSFANGLLDVTLDLPFSAFGSAARHPKPMRFKKHGACESFQSESLKKFVPLTQLMITHGTVIAYLILILLSQTGSLKAGSMQLRLKIFCEGLWLMFSWRICHKRWQIEAWLALQSFSFCLNRRKNE